MRVARVLALAAIVAVAVAAYLLAIGVGPT